MAQSDTSRSDGASEAQSDISPSDTHSVTYDKVIHSKVTPPTDPTTPGGICSGSPPLVNSPIPERLSPAEITGESIEYNYKLEHPDPALGLRGLQDGDWNLVLKSWKRVARRDGVDGKVYFPMMHERIVRLRRRARWVVACYTQDETQIFGFACGEHKNVLHFVFVKQSARRRGIARHMVQALGLKPPFLCTHWSNYAGYIKEHCPPLLVNLEM